MVVEKIGLLSAELNLLFDEYGFISVVSIESPFDVDGATLKINQLSQRLNIVEKTLDGPDSNRPFEIASDLQKIVAGYAALCNYAESNVVTRLKDPMMTLDARIQSVEAAMLDRHFTPNSALTVKYLAMFDVLRTTYGRKFFQADMSDTINSRVTHPLSRYSICAFLELIRLRIYIYI